MTIHKVWNLIARKLAGEASDEELKELDRHVEADSRLDYELRMMEQAWNAPPDAGSEHDYLEATYLLHLDRMRKVGLEPHGNEDQEEHFAEPVPARPAKKFYWVLATVLVAVLAGGAWFWQNGSAGDETAHGPEAAVPEITELHTRNGVKSKFILPDGSEVWLNAGSRLTYQKDFGKTNREVMLTGEGFFDVRKNVQKPFIIHTSSVDIRVLGTAFNVKAYPEDRNTETSLIRGSIELTIRNRPTEKIILSKSEKIIVDNALAAPAGKSRASTADVDAATPKTLVSIKKLKINPVDSSVAETQWVDNKLVFRDESFEELAVKMKRWYDVDIEIRDKVLARERLSGVFTSETVSEALEALRESMSSPFRYEQSGNRITIYR